MDLADGRRRRIAGNLISRRTKFHRLDAEESGRVYVLSKYMQAFILRKSPQNLTAGVTLGECTLSFECNIALPGRQSRRSTARPETIVIALDFILNRTRLWHCQQVCLKIRNIIVTRDTRAAKRARLSSALQFFPPRFVIFNENFISAQLKRRNVQIRCFWIAASN